VAFEFTMWAILMGGIWYMKRWKAKHEPTLSIGEVDEASSTELESQTVRLDDAKTGEKVGVAGPV
jgi:hypothetical protein